MNAPESDKSEVAALNREILDLIDRTNSVDHIERVSVLKAEMARVYRPFLRAIAAAGQTLIELDRRLEIDEKHPYFFEMQSISKGIAELFRRAHIIKSWPFTEEKRDDPDDGDIPVVSPSSGTKPRPSRPVVPVTSV